MKSVKDLNIDFYLVELDNDQFFVSITDSFLEIHILSQALTESAFQLGNWLFVRGEFQMHD